MKEGAGGECFSEVCLMPVHTDLKCEDELKTQAIRSSFLMVILCLRVAASMLSV